MRAEPLVFAFVERVAKALHPYRWWLFPSTIGVCALGGLLMLLGYLGYPAPFFALITPRFGAPLLLTLVAWSWSAFLLSVWFAPKQPHRLSERASYLQRIRHALSYIGKTWALIILAALVLGPLAMWLLIWKPVH